MANNMNNRDAEYRFYSADDAVDEFYREVIEGLGRRQRSIPPKYFYDRKGALLFETICEQPEYYPTITELAILRENAGEIAASVGAGRVLIEPGCGSCDKVRLLLDAVQPHAYVPLDISCAQLQVAAANIAEDFEWLEVHAVCADITDGLEIPELIGDAGRLVFYPGSSIGNFEPDDAVAFLARLAKMTGQGGQLLVGIDLEKDHAILNAAYNDARGITAEFNLNVLKRINRELDADFDIDAFSHRAFYNEAASRIEMHLVSTCRQSVRIDEHTFDFGVGDTIHTENSYKYSDASFRRLALAAGLEPVECWTDADGLFGLHLLEVARQ